jgi:membrane fusion protein, multidrug efflux system
MRAQGREGRPGRSRWPAGLVIRLVAGLLLGAQPEAWTEEKPHEREGVPVTVATVARRAVPLEIDTFGTAQAEASVLVRAQVGEILKEVHIQKGQQVARGDLLFTLESKPFEVALQQARAALARDQVLLVSARREAARQQELLAKKIAAPADADKTQADADALAETVKVDEATIATLQLDLDHCRIHAPIAGRVGKIMVDAGNLVQAKGDPLVQINQISPIDVFFAVPQAELDRVRAYRAQGELEVEAALPSDPAHPEKGRLSFIDNSVDTSTGTIRLGATFPNAEERLWPGRYVRLRLRLTVQADAIVVPARAVGAGSSGQYVFVVKGGQTAELRSVKVARTYGDDVVMASGVEPGEVVVTDGQLQLENGTKVEVLAPVKSVATTPEREGVAP